MWTKYNTDKERRKTMQEAINYKTFTGLVSALQKAKTKPMDTKLAWWLHNAKWVLQNKWGFTEEEASRFIIQFHSNMTAYAATS